VAPPVRSSSARPRGKPHPLPFHSSLGNFIPFLTLSNSEIMHLIEDYGDFFFIPLIIKKNVLFRIYGNEKL
jgi:hypothetical protein